MITATSPRQSTVLALVLSIALVGCGKDDPKKPGDPTDTSTLTTLPTTGSTTTTTTPACSPPLALTPAMGEVPPFQLLQFQASGGTGNYRFELASPALGDVHPTAGTYGAPGEIGAMDQVILTDTQCAGQATADVVVVDHIALIPAAAEVLPGTAFTFETEGGIGATVCSMISSESGATLDPSCAYEAGALEGTDLIEVVDDAGFTAQATIVVDANAILEPEGYAHWVIPLGSDFVAAARGGSGVLDPVVLSGSATVNGTAVEGSAVGRSTVELTDRFAGFQFTVTVDVVPPLLPDEPWVGSRNADTRSIGAGDLNGNGFDDVIVASQELNAQHWEGGAVFVYAGGSGGIDPVPVQQFMGTQRDQALGSSVFVHDVDVDGQPDLLIGAARDDFTSTDIGSVRIHRGVAGGFFEDEPTWVLHGTNGSDRAGVSVGACDLDGDGWPEVIVGADGAEDRSLTNYPSNSGGLLIFRGSATGYADAPTAARYGQRLDATGTAWELARDLDLGERDLAVGDVNGDGLCDVIGSVADDPIDSETGGIGEGYALLWHGTSAGGLLSAQPVRAYANGSDSSADFGRRLELADFDGDGSDDVVVASHAWTTPASTSAGGVFVYLSSLDDGRAATAPYWGVDAHWIATGPGGDNLGRGLGVGDVTGDGVDDLIAGFYLEDVSFSNAGQVRVYDGTAIGSAPAGEQFDTAVVVWDGDEDDARLGESCDAAGDVDGDGQLDLVAVATEHDHYGTDVGRPFVYSNGTDVPLDWTGSAAGDRGGFALTWFDGDGDGDLDLVSGAPQTPEPTIGALVGAADIYANQGGSFATTPIDLPPVMGITTSDRFAEYLGSGDFDGDGLEDLLVGHRQMPTPSSWDPSFDNSAGCGNSWGNAGGVFVYRGTPTGFEAFPGFAWFKDPADSNIEALTSGFDHDGDGYDDFLVADEDWDSGGGFVIVYGRPANPAATVLMCNEPVSLGIESGARLGHAVAALGDIDGDGCDEVAVSADDEDAGSDDRGVVNVLWGWGPGCTSGSPQKTALAPLVDDLEAGRSLAGGGDVDGDGIPDLVVGSIELEVQGSPVGGVWLVSGAYLNSLGRQGFSEGGWVSPGAQTVEDLTEPGRITLLTGSASSVGFGGSVALVRDPVQGSRMALATGVPFGSVGGVPLSGGVLITRWDTAADTWEPNAYAVVGGESHLIPGELGGALQGQPNTSALAVGAPWSHQGGPDRGAAYVCPLD